MEFDLDSGGAIYKRRVKSVKAGNLIKYFLPSSSAYLIFEEFVIRGNRRLHYGFDDSKKAKRVLAFSLFMSRQFEQAGNMISGKKAIRHRDVHFFVLFVSLCVKMS